jgi:hypothetical protein
MALDKEDFERIFATIDAARKRMEEVKLTIIKWHQTMESSRRNIL